MNSVNIIIAIIYKEFLLFYRNFTDVLSIFLFFILGIIIFVFAIGYDDLILNKIGIGIIWALILLSNNLSLRKFYQDDFDNGNLIIFHMSGLSYELIVIIKILTIWIFLQLPFFLIIPIAWLLLNINMQNFELVLLSFLIGSPIITCISSISGSMNLLNKKNFAIGSLIIMVLSIPIIIFSVNLVDTSEEVIRAQINILIGILCFFLAITPWASSLCIKFAIQNN
mgnify:CR=1 FL=1|tara:strand:- start:429 stop:1103 length:675 start_codon:yes stop_codon:yes gene_type:complete